MLNEAYQQTTKKSNHLPEFPESVKRKWIVRRDQNGDEYIAICGKNSLGKTGLDHLYLISENRVGLWLTSKRIYSKVQMLQRSVPGLRIEMIGDRESVLSVGMEKIDELCLATGGRRRRGITSEHREHLLRVSPFARKRKTLIKSAVLASKTSQSGKEVL